MSRGYNKHSFARRIREWSEYIGAKFAIWVVLHSSPRFACSAAKFVGGLAYHLMHKRRRVAIGNILAAHISDDKRTARSIAKNSFKSMALTIVESFLFPRLRQNGAKATVERSDETVSAVRSSKRGVIIVSGHLGNWEIGAQAVSHLKPLTGISRRMNNERVQKLMDEKKMRGDFETIDKHSGRPMDMVRALKRDRALAILTDQHASGDSSVIIDFFGREAATYSTPVVLQHLTGTPIVFVHSVREGFMKFRVNISEPIFYTISKDNKEADILAATQDLANRLEAVIRKYPDQYLWAHRRWKYAEKMNQEK